MSRTQRSLERLRVNCGTKRPAPIYPHANRALQGADRDLCLAAYIVTTLLFCGLTVAPFVLGGFIVDAFAHAIMWMVAAGMMLFFMMMLCVGGD